MDIRRLNSIKLLSISIVCSILIFLIAVNQHAAFYFLLFSGLFFLVITSINQNKPFLLSLIIIFNFLLPPMPTPLGTAIRGGDIILLIVFVIYIVNGFLSGEDFIAKEYFLIILFLMLASIFISMVYGWMRFDIKPTKGDFFEFVKIIMYFAAYRIAYYSDLDRVRRDSLDKVLFTSALVAIIFGWFQISGLFPEIVNRLSLLYSLGQDKAEILYWINKRSQGLFSNPNIFAYFISIILTLIFPKLLFKKRNTRSEYIYYFMIWLVGISALFSTGSRTGILATFISHVYFLIISIRFHGGISKNIIKLFLLIAILLMAVFPIMYKANPFIFNRVISTFKIEELSTFNERTPHWKQYVIPKIESSLFLGYGPSESVHGFSVDNEYLEIILKYGLIGFTFYCLFWAGMIFFGNKLIDSNSFESIFWGIRLHGLVAVCLIFAFFAQAFYYIPQMALVSIYLGLSRSITNQNIRRVFL